MSYRDKFYGKYISTHTSHLYSELTADVFKSAFPTLEDYFKRFLPEKTDAKILDLACGDGGFLYWLQKIGYSSTEGVDKSHEQVELARKLGMENIYEADAIDFLKSKKEKYDIIFARDFLEHLNKNELLEVNDCVFNALKQGGLFIAQTANAETLFGARLRYSDITHEVAFTRVSIEQLLRVVGFSDIKVYPLRPVIHGAFSLVRYLIWRIVEIFLHIVLIAATGYRKGIFTQCFLCVAKK